MCAKGVFYMRSSASTKDGFTLIEIVVAVFIVALITGVAGLAVMNYLSKSRKNTAEIQLRTFKQAIESYYMEIGEYPKTLEDLITKPADERLASRWEPFLAAKKIPLDPWNHPYIYQITPGGAHEFELYSEGPDKKQRIDMWAL